MLFAEFARGAPMKFGIFYEHQLPRPWNDGAEVRLFQEALDQVEKRRMWKEGVEQCTNMMVMDPYPGFKGEFFEMPCRNVVPKPLQKPHPPLWVACSSRETIKLAARYGIGALTFAFVDPREARQWVDDYYRIFREECVPIGHAVNPNVAMVTGFSLHANEAESRRRGEDGLRFFRYGLAHHYIFGEHRPGRTDIWANFEMARRQAMQPMRDEEIPVFVALGRKVAEEGTGTERQKQNAKLWADAAKVTLSDPLRHNPKATVKQQEMDS